MRREVRGPLVPGRRRVAAGALAAVALVASGLAGGARADALPDGRADELVTPGLNGIRVQPGHQFFTQATASGDQLAFVTTDAQDAGASSGVYNAQVATRGATGWSFASVAIPFSAPEASYLGTELLAMSGDLSRLLVLTDQPLAPGAVPGYNLFLGDTTTGTYRAITDASSGSSSSGLSDVGVSADFSHVFFNPDVAQLPSDKVNYHNGSNLYAWSADGLSIVNWLPGAAKPSRVPALLAAGGTNTLSAISADGQAVLFQDENPSGVDPLYLRLNGTSTVQVDLSQKSTPDPNPQASPTSVGITPDGSTVLFTSHSELTDDANTGSADAGADLYAYDVASGRLTDLTPDHGDADGADVQAVIGASADASYVYFVATGHLAAGATAGQPNLYVEHAGTTSFIAPATGLATGSAYTTPDGRSIAFASTASLTGYDNTDATTGAPDSEVYDENAATGTLTCASCRADGTAPTGAATLPASGNGNGVNSPTRVLSDDGGRLFFDSTDRVVPGATNGLQNVYEYENGTASLISPGTGDSPATLVDASPTGDDVFFDSYDDVVPPLDASLESAIWDARVGGGFPITASTEGVCTATVQCRVSGSASTAIPRILTDAGSGRLAGGGRVVFTVRRPALRGSRVLLRVRVSGAGRLTASGRAVRTVRRRVRRRETVTLSLRLTARARGELHRRHRLGLSIRVRYARAGGAARTITIHATAREKGAR